MSGCDDCRRFIFLAIVIMLFSLHVRVSMGAPPRAIPADRLPHLPNTTGFAAPYVGITGDALVVGGGTNFPDAPPWENGTKTWHDSVYVLPSPTAKWLTGFKLPQRLAYGTSLTTDEGVLCIGGCNETSNVASVFLLQWDGRELTRKSMPPLPRPTSCAAGALVGSCVFVAGGQAGPDPASGPSHDDFWMLDLNAEPRSWKALPTWPGPERFYAIAGSDGQSFFLFSGIRRTENSEGRPALEYLKDAYRYDPKAEKWERLADLPHANAAVASPAPYVDGGLVLLGRGADGMGTEVPLSQRKSFGRDALRYDVARGRYEVSGTLPFGLAAVSSTEWNGSAIIASGESRPGVRSPAVWSIPRKALRVGKSE